VFANEASLKYYNLRREHIIRDSKQSTVDIHKTNINDNENTVPSSRHSCVYAYHTSCNKDNISLTLYLYKP